MVTDNTVFKETSYFNIFGCGKNILNRIDTACKQACMANSRDKYYTELLRTITYCNNHNDAPLSNEKIREAIHKSIAEEESDVHTVTVGTFIQTSNTQIENTNAILTSEKLDKLEDMAEG